MRLKKLTLLNFGPYRGEQSLVFPSNGTANVLVVFGDNMRGKTSLLNSLRWCFYNYALGRQHQEIDAVKLLNTDARDDGEYKFGVYVLFEAEGVTYDLRRTAKPYDPVSAPRRESDLKIELTMKKGETILSEDEALHELGLVMPEQISRFFLFDGELLQEYEALLNDDNEQGQRIKKAVEQILGVPALLNGRDEFKTLLKNAQSVLAKDMRHNEGQRDNAEKALRLGEALRALEAQRTEIISREATTRREIDELQEDLDATAEAQAQKSRLDYLKARAAELKKEIAEATDERRASLAVAWKDLLRPRLQVRLSFLETRQQELQGQLERKGALQQNVDIVQALLADGSCRVCGANVDPSKRAALGSQLGQLQADLRGLNDRTEEFGRVSAEIRQLRSLMGGSAADTVRRLKAQLDRASVELTRVEGEAEGIDKALASFDTAELGRKRQLRDQLQVQLGKIQGEGSNVAEAIAAKTLELNQISRLISSTADARVSRSSREVEIYDNLVRLFGTAIDELRDRLRTEVEKKATETFLKLTTEDSYTGLKINNSYGLTIIDRRSRPVTVRSAGAEQIVALSLIDGLSRVARRAGPVIMDTPLGRLDLKHRKKVLAFLPEMGRQIVLLVHEGEIQKAGGLAPLGNHVASKYELVRRSASHSDLVKAT